MRSFKNIAAGGLVITLTACAGVPSGPTVLALPPQGKSFDQFQAEQIDCEQYASHQVQDAADSANTMGVVEGVGGTVLGAGLGAAIGGGRGAAIGAGGGAIAGTAVGGSSSSRAQGGIQHQYDNAFIQCMTAKGNVIQQPAPPPPRAVIYQAPPTVIYQAPPPVVYGYPPPGVYGPGPY